MSRIAIKICGLSKPTEVIAALKAGATHIGFIFLDRSPRYVSFDAATGLIASIPYHIVPVGVMVDPDDEAIARAVAAGVRTIQLHGKETPERVAAIRARHRIPLWKAISVRTKTDLDSAAAYGGAADFLLYDAKTPDSADLPGGMGLRFDWTLLDGMHHPLPWGLSGGLDPANVAEAIHRTGAPLVDISSGVESAPGIKDVDKIAAFCEAVRQS
jgi:phosphoribosylanthranilate isomerase